MNLLARCRDAGWNRLAFIGTTKHAGKTTALNGFLQAAEREAVSVGLCSIGLDGERLDTLLGVAKPSVIAAEGSIVASAERALEQSDAKFEWLEALGIHSPLGEVVLARVTTPGQVLLAGVRQRQHVKLVLDRFETLGCNLSLVDGAFDRMAAAAPELVDAAVLAVGAVAGKTVLDVVAYAAGILHRFQIPVATDGLKKVFHNVWQSGTIGVYAGGTVREMPRHQTVNGLMQHPQWSTDVDAVYLPGAVTDGLLGQFLRVESPITVIASHPAQILASHSSLQRFYRRGHQLFVWNTLPIAAIAANPHHILGYDLPATELILSLQHLAVDIPVYNALAEGGAACGTN